MREPVSFLSRRDEANGDAIDPSANLHYTAPPRARIRPIDAHQSDAASFIAHLIVSKCSESTPQYRLEKSIEVSECRCRGERCAISSIAAGRSFVRFTPPRLRSSLLPPTSMQTRRAPAARSRPSLLHLELRHVRARRLLVRTEPKRRDAEEGARQVHRTPRRARTRHRHALARAFTRDLEARATPQAVRGRRSS